MTANFLMGRRDASRSPPRNELPYDDGEIEDMHSGARGKRGGYENGRGRYGYSGYSGRDPGNSSSDQGYDAAMYDQNYDGGQAYNGRAYQPKDGESRYRNRHDDDGYYEPSRGRSQYDSRSYRGRSRSPARYRSRSRSPASERPAGSPTDTVILEGLPWDMSPEEVGSLFASASSLLEPSHHPLSYRPSSLFASERK
jgi:RNA-binding protein 5/10